jgi:GTP-binding protein
VLVHLVEGANPDPERSPAKDRRAIDRELALHSPELARKPQVVAVTKVDLPEARAAGERFARQLARLKRRVKVHLLSAVTGEGMDGLLDAVAKVLFREAGGRAPSRRRRLGKPRARK